MNENPKSTGMVYAICTGAILGLIGFEIIPEVLRDGGWTVVAAGFLAGVTLFWWIHLIFRFTSSPSVQTTIRPGILLMAAIAVHNFPLGIMMGSGDHVDMSSALMKTLVLHNIPEGMILFMPLFAAGLKVGPMFVISTLIALPVGAGAVFGELLGLGNERLSAFLISLSVGMIYRVAVKEIYPEAVRHSSNAYSLCIAVLSFLLMGLYLLLI
ncbi:ZIP family metal transporter [Bhargavaea ullalensis]|uniref:ZIP family zinc transporter n=1 Tax=Bhargavaea ullalensis TaxID=1265685 RepID=A0ABV2GF16_9BACL